MYPIIINGVLLNLYVNYYSFCRKEKLLVYISMELEKLQVVTEKFLPSKMNYKAV